MTVLQHDPVVRRFLGVSLKMYLDHAETIAWTDDVIRVLNRDARWVERVDVVEFPSFPSIPAVVARTAATGMRVGAQNLSDQADGSLTGEVSGRTLRQVGCSYVEVGHAERRLRYGEDDCVTARKLARAIESGLTPLLCVGEPDAGTAADAGRYCVAQTMAALDALPDSADTATLVVAYEPVWAIGAKTPARDEHIATVCGMIRGWLAAHWPGVPARVVYGGSAGPDLYSRLAAEVDGLFLGRFAHDPGMFAEVLSEMVAVC